MELDINWDLIELGGEDADKLSQAFDKCMKLALSDPERYLEIYTEEMSGDDDALTEGVIIDD
jgi:hypothetical protein